MNWKDYEETTKFIYETLGKDKGVSIECYGNSCKVVGKSTVEHQIDVLTKHSDGIHEYKTAIECKYWNDNINKDIIMKVAEIVEDAGLNKGIIVSKKGFTKDATDFAKYRNIGLVELREMNEKDWEGRIKDIVLNMNMLIPEITKMDLVLNENTEPNFHQGMTRVEFLEIKSEDKNLTVEGIIKEFTNELLKQEENKEHKKIVKFDSETKIVYKPTEQILPIRGMKFTGFLRIAKEKIEIKGEDHIWLIMKSIFENKTYTISKNGEIHERPNE
ncbi:restriction endonuclease [Winogradskyella sediminis]|uniref:Restriction endonuclease n=1 Tax=Winogradskyella sediminis TaxID=1382466 RepID=A0A1H1X395_9FLAO|nr:restriction endonuclease [Winogradskyella sediminis]SDT03817.1 Restriction endonuclease [Winogradskyella sediminis]